VTETTALVTQIHARSIPSVFAVTGGGATTLATLLNVPGASRTVLETCIPYHPNALADFLGFVPTQSCSAETARAMAQRAFDRARQLAPGVATAGVGVTASLATDRPKHGEHRFHFTVQTRLYATNGSLTLHKGQRDRAGEECVLNAILLNALAETFGIAERLPVPLLPGEELARSVDPATDPLAQLAAGRVTAICHEPDGRLRTDSAKPAALLCGSFNPLHAGHLRLAEIAAQILGMPVAFELTLHNADKPAMEIEEGERRARQFIGQYPLWLTAAPTFAAKAALFPGATWVVGADTAARIVQSHFYGGEPERDLALAELRSIDCRFLVAGRRTAEGNFLSLDRIEIPAAFRDLFRVIPESEYRMDVSSTELRR
jgi:nicotinamide mononucleotide (NMN) deamidase PncC